MAGETILIVEDSPVSLKLTAALLRAEGYKVHIASNGEQALSTLHTLRPRLMLVDIQLPGISGLELTRRVKQDDNLHQMVVVALTGSAQEGDVQRANEAGCAGFLTKSADTRALVARVREYLGQGGNAPPAPAANATPPVEPVPEPVSFGLPESEMEDLRRSFLADGVVESRHLLASLDSQFQASTASRIVHRWTGTAGLLGFAGISGLAHEVETLLSTPAASLAQLRASLTNLAHAFADPDVATREALLPDFIVQELAGKRVALIGFGEAEADRICAALERAGAKPRLFEASDPADSHPIRECNVLMIHVRAETLSSQWLDPDLLAPPLIPLVLIGRRESLLSLDTNVQSRACEFLIDGWQPEEALMRLSFALARAGGAMPGTPSITRASTEREPSAATPGPSARHPVTTVAEIVVADDDVTVRTLVRAALENDGMHCRLAPNGPEALQLVRDHRPHVAVLDVNMPGMDGFEVLTTIRAEALPVRVILLTSRQNQNDVVRGFSLGADDYIVKPFRPAELVARLKRLLT
ncbi:MAG: response regulator [Acidobacteriia bacterium]|nr:response regulator [Terriglobia bacterium]